MNKFSWIAKHFNPIKTEKIRIGNNSDGGYILPIKCLDSADLCVSYGLGPNITFELELISRNIKVLGFDKYITKKIPWAKEKILRQYQDVSELPEVKKSENIILKIDVEGGEWNFFKTIDTNHFSKCVSCFVFELHLQMNYKKIPLSIMEKMFDSHYVIHVHGNNFSYVKDFIPNSLEITLAHKKFFNKIEIDKQKYPIKNIDYANHVKKQDVSLSWLPLIKMI